jgi:glucose/mannose-6-phosphate isomerase
VSAVERLDTLGMFEAAATLGDQVRAAAAAAASVDGLPSAEGVTSVVVAGMGGSGIGGDLTAALCGPILDVPVIVPKGYEIPNFVGPDTLIFCVSSSGNTEETVQVARHAVDRGARLVVISSGGELGRLAGEWGVPLIPVDPTIPMPREVALAADHPTPGPRSCASTVRRPRPWPAGSGGRCRSSTGAGSSARSRRCGGRASSTRTPRSPRSPTASPS